jgi:hypothetical protein
MTTTSPDFARTSPGEVMADLAQFAPCLRQGEVRGEVPGEVNDQHDTGEVKPSSPADELEQLDESATESEKP